MMLKKTLPWASQLMRQCLRARRTILAPYCTAGGTEPTDTNSGDARFRDILTACTGGSVDLEKDNETGIAVVTLNNPQKKNALSGRMMLDLRQAVEDLEDWYLGKGVILRGAKDTFCSGGDLDTVKNILTPELGYQMSDYMHETMTRLLHLPMISVALVQGDALGGGAELLTSCDFRILTSQARVAFVQTKMGLVTGWAGGTHLVKLIGRRKALDLLSSGRILEAEECLRISLADEVIPVTDNSLEMTRAWLTQYVAKDAKLIRTVKAMVIVADDTDVDTSLEVEKDLFKSVWGGELQLKALSKNLKH